MLGCSPSLSIFFWRIDFWSISYNPQQFFSTITILFSVGFLNAAAVEHPSCNALYRSMYSTFKHEKGHIAPGDPGFSWVQARIAHVMKTQMGPSGNVASINIYIYIEMSEFYLQMMCQKLTWTSLVLQGFDHHCRYLNVCVAGRCVGPRWESNMTGEWFIVI